MMQAGLFKLKLLESQKLTTTNKNFRGIVWNFIIYCHR